MGDESIHKITNDKGIKFIVQAAPPELAHVREQGWNRAAERKPEAIRSNADLTAKYDQVRALLKVDLPADSAFRDLGGHMLKPVGSVPDSAAASTNCPSSSKAARTSSRRPRTATLAPA